MIRALSQAMAGRWPGLLRVLAAGTLALAACSTSPTSPLEIGQLSLGAAYDVFVRGGTGYVANNEGVAVLDVGDIRRPRRVTLISEGSGGGSVAGFSVSGDTLLTFGDHLSLHDISQPQTPNLLTRYTGRAFIGAARIQGRYVYLAYLHGGLEVVDLVDPANPVAMGFAPFSGQINDLAIRGDFAYLANSHSGLEVVDVSDPGAPSMLGALPGTSGAWDIHVQENRLYLGCHRYGVRVLDISDPGHPTVLGEFNNGGETYGVFAVGHRLYTVDLQDGVEVLDISTPGSPTLIMWDRHYHPHDLYSDGSYLYLADQDAHFVVLPLDLQEDH